MPAALPAIAGLIAGSAAKAAVTMGILKGISASLAFTIGSMAGSLIVGQIQAKHQQRKAERAARSQYEATLTDRAVMVRSATEPRRIIYGEQVASGPIVFVGTNGEWKDYLTLVIALASHEVTEIGDIILNDQTIPADKFNADGWCTDSRYAKGIQEDGTEEETLPQQYREESEVITAFAGQPALISRPVDESEPVTVSWDTGEVDYVDDGVIGVQAKPRLVELSSSDYTRSGQAISVTNPAYVGARLRVTYTRAENDDLARSSGDNAKYYLRVKKFLGSEGQAADQYLVDNFPDQWSSEHQGKGVAYISVTLRYDQDIYPTGVPQVKAVVKGKPVYDPRSGSTAYSDNSALIAADWLQHRYGFRCDYDEIDWNTVIAAANICEETVQLGPNYDNETQSRYTCHGVISAEGDRKSGLSDICGSMAGGAVFVQGTWKIYAGAYRVPTLTLTEDDITDVSPVNVVSRMPRSELFNAVSGKYHLPAPETGQAEFPPMTNPFYAEEDGDIIFTDLDLPFVNHSTRAQRLAKITLERSRQAIVATAGFNFRAYPLMPFDTVRLSLPRFGWDNKVFRVADREFSPEAALQLVLVEEAAGVYEWNNGEATDYDLAPNTGLPNPFQVAAPQNLLVESGESLMQILPDGTTNHRLHVTWDASKDPEVIHGGATEIEYRLQTEPSNWHLIQAAGVASESYVNDVQPGRDYIVRARFVNGLGVHSVWTYSQSGVVEGRGEFPFVPFSLYAEGAVFSIRINWAFPENVLDIGSTEIYYGTTADLEAASSLGKFPFPQTSHTISGLGPGEGFYFWARLIDRSGNAGEFYPVGAGVYAESSTDAEDILDYLSEQINKTELAKELAKEISDASVIADEAHGRAEEARERAYEAMERAQRTIESLRRTVDDIEVAKLLTSAERYIREEEDTVVDRRVEELQAEVSEDIGASIYEVYEALANADEAVSQHFALLEAQVEDNSSQIVQQAAAFADEMGSMAETHEGMVAQMGDDIEALIVAEAQVRADELGALATQTESMVATWGDDLEAMIHSESLTRADELGALAQQTDTLVAQLGDDIEALVVNESLARADDLEALATQTNLLIADFTEDINATILSEQTARADADSALASSLNLLEVQVGDNEALILNEQTARADADSAMASDISLLEVKVEDNEAAIIDESVARADAISSEATRVNSLLTSMGDDISSQITTVQNSVSTLDSTTASQVQALTSDYQSVRADLTTESNTRASADGALSDQVTIAQVKAEGAEVSASNAVSAAVDAQGKLSAMNSLKVQTRLANGEVYVAGMGIGVESDGTIGGTTSDIIFDADRIAFTNTRYGDKYYPFVIEGNRVYLDTAIIKDADIDTAKIRNLEAEIISAVHGQFATLQVGEAQIEDLSVSRLKIRGGAVTSGALDNFNRGSLPQAGWQTLGSASLTIPANQNNGEYLFVARVENTYQNISIGENSPFFVQVTHNGNQVGALRYLTYSYEPNTEFLGQGIARNFLLVMQLRATAGTLTVHLVKNHTGVTSATGSIGLYGFMR